MKSLSTLLLSLSLVLLTSSAAFAQSGGSAPAGGAGATTGTGSTPGTAAIDPLVDLPMDKPDLKAVKPPAPPAPTPPPQDPTDTDKPPTIYGHDLNSPNKTIFYVIDVSGSMGWDMGQYTTPDGQTSQGDRLDRAKSQLIMSVMSLPSDFNFNMLSFDCDVYQWQGAMVPADDSNKQAALGRINALQPLGATGTGPATASALGQKNNMLVVLLTDGAPNCGAGDESGDDQCMNAHRKMIDAANSQHAVINVFAIGATDDFEAFCQGVASDNGGTCTDVH